MTLSSKLQITDVFLNFNIKVMKLNCILFVYTFDLMTYLSQNPSSYQYSAQSYSSNVKASYSGENDDKFRKFSNAATKPQPNRYGESQVNQVYKPIRVSNQHKSHFQPNSIVQTPPPSQMPISNQQTISNSVKTLQNRQTISKTLYTAPPTSADTRYSNYLKQSETHTYKYNIFSFMDQPWNNCLQGNKCGSCPNNECLPRETLRQYWN